MTTVKNPQTIDEYIADCPVSIQSKLHQLRLTIRQACPEAIEKMSWAMPTFAYHGNLVHFATHTHHIGFYPGPSAIVEFAAELAKYKTSKGAIQFPHDEVLPFDLIVKMVLFGVAENLTKAQLKSQKR